jgi:hypothetical protein
MTSNSNPPACKVRIEGPPGNKLTDHAQRLRAALSAVDPSVEIEIVELAMDSPDSVSKDILTSSSLILIVLSLLLSLNLNLILISSV